jgi:hypothetical protein
VIVFALAVALPAAARAQDEENPLDGEPAPVEPKEPPAETAPAQPEQPEAAPEPEATVTGGIPTAQIGLGAGVYIPTSALGVNFLVGVDAAYQLPFMGGRFGVGAGLAYSQPATEGVIDDDRVPGGSAEYSSTMRELVLDFLFTFRLFGWDSAWSPHAGLGTLIYFLDHKVRSLGVEQTEGATKAGLLVTLGVDYYIWHGCLVGEVRFPFALVDQRTTGDSNVGALAVVFGYRFHL